MANLPTKTKSIKFTYTIWPDCGSVTITKPASQRYQNDRYSDGSILAGQSYSAHDHIGLAIGFDKDY